MNNEHCEINTEENNFRKIDSTLLEILLQDKTSGKNIIWATDNYVQSGVSYEFTSQITTDLITLKNENIIKPRTKKSKKEQEMRSREKAEVFTPSGICNSQNNLIDEAWFNRKNVFNVASEDFHSWVTNPDKIEFPEDEKKNWQNYVMEKRIEISCGEAPYLTSRYDSVTGDFIEVPDRIGLLDRKLRIVHENTDSREEWLNWAYKALTSIYGFEWQGDNLLIARENILFTIVEHYSYKFNETIPAENLIKYAEVISWNIWQMDGLKFVIPNSCKKQDVIDADLFGTRIISKGCDGCKNNDIRNHNGIYCTITDWETGEKLKYVDLVTHLK